MLLEDSFWLNNAKPSLLSPELDIIVGKLLVKTRDSKCMKAQSRIKTCRIMKFLLKRDPSVPKKRAKRRKVKKHDGLLKKKNGTKCKKGYSMNPHAAPSFSLVVPNRRSYPLY